MGIDFGPPKRVISHTYKHEVHQVKKECSWTILWGRTTCWSKYAGATNSSSYKQSTFAVKAWVYLRQVR